MPIDRTLWQSTISATIVPNWPCPACGATSLTLTPTSFQTKHSADTRQSWNDEELDPEQEVGTFVCLLECAKPGCNESCAVSGCYSITVEDLIEGPIFRKDGNPKMVTPALRLIDIPKGCPPAISDEICAAFSVFWCDYSAALNRIRSAIELLLTQFGIKKQVITKAGRRERLSLNARIDILRKKKPSLKSLCDRLLAVKHLGNAGSHPGDVLIDDLFDGFDILEQILHDAFSSHAGELAKMVRQINSRKGPRNKSN